MMWAQLGDIVFELAKTPVEGGVQTNLSWEYAEHKVIEGKALLQYLGESLEEIDITIRFHYGFCEPMEEERRILEEARKHKPLPFILGTGDLVGYYVIEQATRTWLETHKTGQVIYLEMQLHLKECPPEKKKVEG